MDKLKEIVGVLEDRKAKKGFEFYPFKIRWYNSCVQPVFHLPYHEDTLCLLVVSIPKMFECTLKPFILSGYSRGLAEEGLDPVDQCMRVEFREMQGILQEYETDTILDYELHPTRRPKILVQTAGHVSGAAFYYQKEMVSNPPWGPHQKIYGVSMHPKYGGWFAFRGVIIVKNVQLVVEEFKQRKPEQCVGSEDRIIELLDHFNGSWQDGVYRDIMAKPVIERYSDEQKEYFVTLPKERYKLVSRWIEENNASETL